RVRTSARTRSRGSERLCPRTYGITQNEQRLSHPSCTLRFGRVLRLAASNTGAASSSVCAKISPTTTGAPSLRVLCATVGLGSPGCPILARSLRKGGIRSRSPESCPTGTKPEPEEEEEVAISAAWCLCELPTTHVTPGRAASSSGARCA